MARVNIKTHNTLFLRLMQKTLFSKVFPKINSVPTNTTSEIAPQKYRK